MPLFGSHPADTTTTGVLTLSLGLAVLALEGWYFFWRQKRRKPDFSVSRRPVPWGILDIVLVGCVGFFGIVLLASFIVYLFPAAAKTTSTAFTADHPVILLIQNQQWFSLLVCGIAVVLVAPLVEEFFFRVLWQGWLEKVERQGRRTLPMLRRWLPRGVVPVLLSALPFALLHYRTQERPPSETYLVYILLGDSVVKVLVVIFALAWLRVVRRATAADLGWAPGKLFSDLLLGLLVFFAVFVPIFYIRIGSDLLFPQNIASDPLPLFFFAVVLGGLYYSTRRVVPLITIHLALNAVMFSLALWIFWSCP